VKRNPPIRCKMPEYHRLYIKGGTYFFTAVTFKRRHIFTEAAACQMLRDCIELTGNIKPFVVNALVILPDHIHTIWTLPEHDVDFSTRWKVLKTLFSKRYRKQASKDLLIPRSGRGEVGIWQRRFWEHLIKKSGRLQYPLRLPPL
jgi:putative transposase